MDPLHHMCTVCGIDEDTARSFLQHHGGGIEAAVNAYYESGGVIHPPQSAAQIPSDGVGMWETATSKQKNKNKNKKQAHHPTGSGAGSASDARVAALAELDVHRFLSEFKTSQCTQREHHDRSLCMGHHGQDRRRNPFLHQHSPEEAQSVQEKMYHPLLYRKGTCTLAEEGRCPRGELCSFAHGESQIRSFDAADYAMVFQKRRQPTQTLQAFVPTTTANPEMRRSLSVPTSYSWGGAFDNVVARGGETTLELPLTPWQRFAWTESPALQEQVKAACIGYCRVEHR